MLYEHCVLYRSSDPEKKPLKYIDIESDSVMTAIGGFTEGGVYEESAMYLVRPKTEYNYQTGMKIFIPDVGDYKITGFTKIARNNGRWKKHYRYTLTLEG